MPGEALNLKTKDVIMCCSVRTIRHLRRVVTDEYRAKVEWLTQGNWRNTEKNLPQWHYFHHKSQIKSPTTEPENQLWEDSTYLPELQHGHTRTTTLKLKYDKSTQFFSKANSNMSTRTPNTSHHCATNIKTFSVSLPKGSVLPELPPPHLQTITTGHHDNTIPNILTCHWRSLYATIQFHKLITGWLRGRWDRGPRPKAH